MTAPGQPYIGPVEAKGWHLYEVEVDRPLFASDWDRLQQIGPAHQVEEGGVYVFAPEPHHGQRLGEAYTALDGGIGPSLNIRDAQSEDYPGLALRFSLQFAIFSRLAMGAARVRLYSPHIPGVPQLDIVELDRKTGPAVFARDFDIISPAEFQARLARNQ
ncbi:MAG TPA: hypothetical protein VLF43_03785 [Candidatus Saccharimonadales bacterium]|nr:hypothetical protein [Candidatus Saccharimonadales bacterium]